MAAAEVTSKMPDIVSGPLDMTSVFYRARGHATAVGFKYTAKELPGWFDAMEDIGWRFIQSIPNYRQPISGTVFMFRRVPTE